MKFEKVVNGFRNDFGHTKMFQRVKLFQKTMFQVNYTADDKGKTFSIADMATGVQYSIPFDEIMKLIDGGENENQG